MSQIAVQGKTLWMLTAGVMTPVLSSLAADALQNPLKNLIETSRYQRQTEELKNLNKLLKLFSETKIIPELLISINCMKISA